MSDTVPSREASAGAARRIVVSASLDNLRSSHVRLLQEAARLGAVHVRLSSDALIESGTGRSPQFPEMERLFLARALRCVDSAGVARRPALATLPTLEPRPDLLVVTGAEDNHDLRARCLALGIDYRAFGAEDLVGFPPFDDEGAAAPSAARRVVVTGCFDWFHSGHVRFFMDAAAFGELYVVVGSDENVRLLKGPGHPLQPQAERRYMVQAARTVHRALISTGTGWMDAEPEIDAIAPHVYVVNEDGDQPEKRAFCRARGLDYVVLKRRPHRHLPRRTSTDLRGVNAYGTKAI
jgi:cytidyltransferase-like protein